MMNKSDDTERVVNTICHDHCQNACLLKLHVRDGEITRVETLRPTMAPSLNTEPAPRVVLTASSCITLTGSNTPFGE
jgi:hypothetical protein